MNSIERVEFMFEDMQGKFDFLVEVIGILQKDVAEMKPKVDRIPFIERDIELFKVISREHSLQIHNHEGRLTNLEAA